MISFIIPTYNESNYIQYTLKKLLEIIDDQDEVIVVDGNSEDNTVEFVKIFTNVKRIENCNKGRAIQMNKGAEIAKNKYLLFLHADTTLDKQGLQTLKYAIEKHNIDWGWFRLRFDSDKYIYRILEKLTEFRNDLIQEPVGDHGIFVKKSLFDEVKGYPEVTLMEDVELTKKLKKLQKGTKINFPITTSARRFEANGVYKTTAKMCLLRALHFFRVKSSLLSKHYEDSR